MSRKYQNHKIYRITVKNWPNYYYVCATTDKKALAAVYQYVHDKYPAICLAVRNYVEFTPEDFTIGYSFPVWALDRDDQIKYFGKERDKVFEKEDVMIVTEDV